MLPVRIEISLMDIDRTTTKQELLKVGTNIDKPVEGGQIRVLGVHNGRHYVSPLKLLGAEVGWWRGQSGGQQSAMCKVCFFFHLDTHK